jgi:hypothetical protein
MERFNSSEDIEFDPTAFKAGSDARPAGAKMDDHTANPYVGRGNSDFLYRSFCAGYADMIISSEEVTRNEEKFMTQRKLGRQWELLKAA